MKIAHASDTHDRPSIVTAVAEIDADVILLTGDIMANKGRIRMGGWDGPSGIVPMLERKYQESWFRKVAKKWARAFNDRPIVSVSGNHDFISPARWLRHYGATVYEITDETPYVDLLGKRFAGFRQINWIAGEWAGECHDMAPHVERAMSCDPDILVTHAPPSGILVGGEDGDEDYGIAALTTALTYHPHKITHHFFGHAHKGCGIQEEMGITFINSAGMLRVVDVP